MSSGEDESDIVIGKNPGLPADRRAAARWVQYEAPVFVRVEPDEDGRGTEITKVIVVVEPDDLNLARDHRGHFLVYDSQFKPIPPSRQYETLDGLRTAVSVAEDRHRWPAENMVAACDGWDTGPDPRHDPFYYAGDDEVEEDDEDDGEDDDCELADIN
jgi:hypothetical protein